MIVGEWSRVIFLVFMIKPVHKYWKWPCPPPHLSKNNTLASMLEDKLMNNSIPSCWQLPTSVKLNVICNLEFLNNKKINNKQINPHTHTYFSFQPVLHDWCNKGCGMCYPVYGIKEPLLLIGKSSTCGGSGFPLAIWMVLYHMSNAI